MTCLVTPYELASLGLGALTLVILGITLRWVRRYTRAAEAQVAAAERTAKAANEQAEAAQKPCLVFDAIPRGDMSAIADAPHAMELRSGDTQIRNIGIGPAIGISFFCERKQGETWESGLRFDAPHLRPGEAIAFPTTKGISSGEWRLTLICQSTSGQKHITRALTDDRVFQSFEFRPMEKDEVLPTPAPSPWEQATRKPKGFA